MTRDNILKFHDYTEQVRAAMRANPSWRAGQAAFNVLLVTYPDLAELVRGTDFDPFYATVGDAHYKRFMTMLMMVDWP